MPDLLAVMFDSLDAKGGCHMCLASAGAADEHHIVRAIDKVTAVQLADQSLVDLAGSKVEHRQILVSREPGSLDLIGDRADLAFSNLCLEEL